MYGGDDDRKHSVKMKRGKKRIERKKDEGYHKYVICSTMGE